MYISLYIDGIKVLSKLVEFPEVDGNASGLKKFEVRESVVKNMKEKIKMEMEADLQKAKFWEIVLENVKSKFTVVEIQTEVVDEEVNVIQMRDKGKYSNHSPFGIADEANR